MRKAIIVIEEPNKCSECPLYDHTFWSCNYTGSKGDIFTDKLLDCPLKPMPERYLEFDVADEEKSYTDGFHVGYNSCIDEILEGNKDE